VLLVALALSLPSTRMKSWALTTGLSSSFVPFITVLMELGCSQAFVDSCNEIKAKGSMPYSRLEEGSRKAPDVKRWLMHAFRSQSI
jgi:hypothetical protein